MRAARAAAAVLISLLLTAGDAPHRRPVEVRLNDHVLSPALLVASGERQAVFVPVSGLARAIGGSAATWRSWLRLEDLSLYATTEGGCATCPVHVRRTVLISSRLRMIAGEPHLPLTDLVAAFEGRLGSDEHAGVYTIFAGRCTWCVLEARDR